jgi:hypothetical protein
VEERAVRITNKNDIAAINFAALATATPTFDDRSWEYLCVRDRYVVGTDTHRIHRAFLESTIENGLYALVKSTKKEIIIERIKDEGGYPSQTAIDKYLQITGRKVEVKEKILKFLPAILVYLVGGNGQAIKPEYLIDVCRFLPSANVIVTLPSDPTHGVHILHTSENMEAFIMPIVLNSSKIVERKY